MSTDDLDAFPLDPIETNDSDGDGFGDNLEITEGTDPFDAKKSLISHAFRYG